MPIISRKLQRRFDPGHESSRESDVSIEILQPKLRPHVSACVPKSKSPNQGGGGSAVAVLDLVSGSGK